ncbi:MAG: hypothetical protein WCY15_00610 [Phenylobacterium sp.]|uniref:hypothetical protein n=1 Tax=Phenylobacterium sp. TaxID=1871053 RepID=UPI002A35EA7B|nr:hypothetical protein [Phenylobacterium sp.]MDX9999023.1 hypothetical protein [Phenylobacterium sp.]
MDGSIANVALPTIGRELAVTMAILFHAALSGPTTTALATASAIALAAAVVSLLRLRARPASAPAEAAPADG